MRLVKNKEVVVSDRKAGRKESIMKNTMINIFKKLGFEEIICTPVIHDDDMFRLYQCDFEAGGKMERFANYTKQRFEEEFDVIVWCA